jgi:hypothetical protein
LSIPTNKHKYFEVQKYPHILIRRPTQQSPLPCPQQLSWSGANCHLRPKSNYGWHFAYSFLFVGTNQWPPKWMDCAHSFGPLQSPICSAPQSRVSAGLSRTTSHSIPSQLMYIVQYIPPLVIGCWFFPICHEWPFFIMSSGHSRQSGGGPSPGHWGRENPKLRLPVVFLGQTGSQQCC